MPVSDASITRTLNDSSTGSVTVERGALPFDIYDVAVPWTRIFVGCWDDTPVFAGYPLSLNEDLTTGKVQVSLTDVRAILSRRYPFGIASHSGATIGGYGDITVTSRNYSGAVRAILSSMIGDDSEIWNLPISLPADGSGSISDTFHGYEFQYVDDLLTDYQNADGGPDIDFRPRWNGTSAWWDVVVGSPRLTGATREWNWTARDPGIVDLKVVLDGSKQLTGSWAVGKGSEEDMRVGTAGSMSGTKVMNLDNSAQFKTVSDSSKLNSRASAELKTHREATQQWSLSVKSGEVVTPATARLGMRANVYLGSHPLASGGWVKGYVIGLGFGTDDTISVQLQQIGG